MKKIYAVLFAVCIMGFITGSAVAKGKQGGLLSFAVVSDIHTDAIKLNAAMEDIYSINPLYDVLVMNGDTVDVGTPAHYNVINAVLLKNRSILPNGEKIIRNIGNHEFYTAEKNVSTQELINRYLKFSRQKNVYHDTWIKGYHFISLGSEKCNVLGLENNGTAYLSEEQLKWFSNSIKENYVQNKPIFVFLHQPLRDSVAGSKINHYKNHSIHQDAELRDILSKYPEVIFFTSHTHWKVEIPGTFVKDKFFMCDTSSLSKPWGPDGYGKEKAFKGSEGLYVEVYKNKVIIKGRDFQKKAWLNDSTYTVEMDKNKKSR